MYWTEELTPKEALDALERIIVKDANCGHWRNIVSGDNVSGAVTDLFDLWMSSVNEVFGDKTDDKPAEKALRLFGLIDRIIKAVAIYADGGFDSEITRFAAHALLGWIVSCFPSADAISLWHRFIALADKRDLYSTRYVFSCDILGSQFQQAFRYMGKEKAAQLIEATPQATYEPSRKLTEEAIEQLWISLTRKQAGLQVKWSRIIHSTMRFQDQAVDLVVSEAITKAVGKICDFAMALAELSPAITALKLPILDSGAIIQADYSTQQISGVTVYLNGNHCDFCFKSIDDQRRLAHQYVTKIVRVVSDWASKNGIKGMFDISVLGTLIELSKKQFPQPSEAFRSVVPISTTNS